VQLWIDSKDLVRVSLVKPAEILRHDAFVIPQSKPRRAWS
jgi:hypothetical protein